MQLKELQPRQGKVEVTVTVIEKDEPRTFSKFNSQGRVCNAKVQDDSGTMTLSLWNEQVDQVNVGDVIAIKNGYVSEWQGEMQLSTGKFGQLEIVSKGAGAPPQPTSSSASKPVKPAPKLPSSQSTLVAEEDLDDDLAEDDEVYSDFEEEKLD